jgi:tetratricopeptide (TPR) repeat protein
MALPKRSKGSRSNRRDVKKPPQPNLRATSDGPPAWAAAIVLALAISAVYASALDVPFIFDDTVGIVKNKSIQSLWPPIGTADNPGPLNPPLDNPVSARPLVNLTFAINWRLGGFDPYGYHLVNVLVHFCSAILLWAVVRPALRLSYFAGRFESSAGWLALVVALLWALHPLQTEAVIYASQRTELMMAMFYIGTLYCSLRYWALVASPIGEARPRSESRQRKIWLVLAVLACLAGMASKEVMVSAPLVVLLFDRTFVSDSLVQTLRRFWPLYLGLAATWGLLLFLNIGAPRGASAGFDLGVDMGSYWLMQAKVLLMYLGLVVRPWPLLVHYKFPYFAFREGWLYLVPVLLLGLGTLLLLWRNQPAGFLVTCVFVILAPTSLIPIVTEMAAERRMYLPLAPIAVLIVVAAYLLAQRVLQNRVEESRTMFGFKLSRVLMTVPVVVLLLAAGVASAKRLDEYHTPFNMWEQVLRYQPQNSIAYQNKGFILWEGSNFSAAIEQYREGIRLAPDSIEARYNLSTILLQTGEAAKAVDELRSAVALVPNDAAMRNNLATALYMSHRYDEAVEAYRATLKLDPDNWQIHKNFGITLEKAGKYHSAIESFENALRLNPAAIATYLDMAKTYSLAGQPEKATAALQQGLQRARAAGDVAAAAKFIAQLDPAH